MGDSVIYDSITEYLKSEHKYFYDFLRDFSILDEVERVHCGGMLSEKVYYNKFVIIPPKSFVTAFEQAKKKKIKTNASQYLTAGDDEKIFVLENLLRSLFIRYNGAELRKGNTKTAVTINYFPVEITAKETNQFNINIMDFAKFKARWVKDALFINGDRHIGLLEVDESAVSDLQKIFVKKNVDELIEIQNNTKDTLKSNRTKSSEKYTAKSSGKPSRKLQNNAPVNFDSDESDPENDDGFDSEIFSCYTQECDHIKSDENWLSKVPEND